MSEYELEKWNEEQERKAVALKKAKQDVKEAEEKLKRIRANHK